MNICIYSVYRAVYLLLACEQQLEQCLWSIVSYIERLSTMILGHIPGGMILEVVSYERPVHALSRLHEFRKVGRLVNV